MSAKFSKIQPYLEIDDKSHDNFDFIINKKGDVAIPFELELPEIYTVGKDQFSQLKDSMDKALGLFTKEAIFQRQDFFFKDTFQGLKVEREGFLHQAHEQHFFERGFTNHQSYLYYILPNQRQLNRNILSSTLFNKGRSRITDFESRKEKLFEFIAQVERSIQIITDTKQIGIRSLKKSKIIELMYTYFTLSKDCRKISDFGIDENRDLLAGDNRIRIYSLNDTELQPDKVSPSSRHEEFSTDTTRMDTSFLLPLTFGLDCNHIINTIIFKEEKGIYLKELEKTNSQQKSIRFLSSENDIIHRANLGYLKDCEQGYKTPVRQHTNLMIWSNDKNDLLAQDNKAVSAFHKINAVPHLEKLTPALIFWASAPGNAGDLPAEESFPTLLEIANCCQNYETNYRSGVDGIVFCDRLTQKPVIVDTWDEPYKKKLIANRNCIVVGPSGEGKSVLMNHIFSQYLQQNYNLVVLDIGNSYKKSCELFNGKYLVYDIDKPIPFNPFIVKDNNPNAEDLDFLVNLLSICWQRKEVSPETVVILKRSLEAYYKNLKSDNSIFPGFPSFYDFIKDSYSETIRKEFKDEFFDLESFLLVLEDFAHGQYKHLFNSKTTLDIKSDRFVVFELDNIKDHPILFPIVAMIITHTIDKTIFKAKGVRKAVWMDEAWKIVEKEGMDQYLKYLFKTVRKHQGQVGIIIQDITDLPDNQTGNAIINNCANKLILSHKKNQNMIPVIAKRMSLTEHATGILASATSNLSEGYTEFFYMMGSLPKVYRLELSKESLWAFSSDEDDNIQINNEMKKHGNIKLAIKQIIENQKK